MEKTRRSISLPSSTRCFGQTPLAAKASRHAALSEVDPRASSKNLARVCCCRFPLPSAMFSSTDRLARSNCLRTSTVLPDACCWTSSMSVVTQRMNFNCNRYTSSFSWSSTGSFLGKKAAGLPRGVHIASRGLSPMHVNLRQPGSPTMSLAERFADEISLERRIHCGSTTVRLAQTAG